MQTPRSVAVWRVSAVAAAGAWALVANLGAAEDAAKASTAAAGTTPAPLGTDDSIAVAKRDLEAIKAARGGVEQPKAGLPQFSTPELQTAVPMPGRPALTPGEAAKRRSANWLVEAMMKKPAQSTDGKDRGVWGGGGKVDDSGKGPGADGPRFGDDLVTIAASEAEREKAKAARAAQQSPGQRPDDRTAMDANAVVNPLTNYMAMWMTSQDFKLLQSGGKREGETGLGGGGGVGVGANGSGLILPTGAAGGPTGTAGTMSGLPGGRRQQRENPFLQELIPSVAAPASVKPLAPVATAPATAATLPKNAVTPPPEPLPQTTATPSFVKPNDDAKYFKPLKRF
jgi:hypothetical protein